LGLCVSSDGSSLGTGNVSLNSLSGLVVVGFGVVSGSGSYGIGSSLNKSSVGSSSFSMGSAVFFGGSSDGSLGVVPFSESLILEVEGGGGGFGGSLVSGL
jgi:hypothetical protein